MTISRRGFSKAVGAASMAGWLANGTPVAAQAQSYFNHGVASGDPLENAVIIWTRITFRNDSALPVYWKVCADPEMRVQVRKGQLYAQAEQDYTIKVDVQGLQPGTTYYYQFYYTGQVSPIGRTKTLPVGSTARLRIGVASCSNLPYGFFNSYRSLANRTDLDCILHLGDYIYEYGNGEFGNGTLTGRIPEPDREILTLDDYRTRYAQYREDPDLQEVHRQHPFVIVWDDHEIANDAWNAGAENHNPGEGDFFARKAAAVRAWNEWQPVRETSLVQMGRIYRTFRFGDLADLIMLDTRNFDRDQQVAADSPAIADPSRSLLGEEQEAWFYGQLSTSRAQGRTWRLVGQQVMMGQLFGPTGTPFNPDQWDGYLASRNRFLGYVAQNAISNVVVLTGDIHSSWGNDITFNPFNPAMYNAATGTGSLAVEFVTPGITSPAFDDAPTAAALGAQVLASHPHVKKVDLFNRGYMVLDVTPDRVQTEWYHPLTLSIRTAAESYGGALQVVSNTSHLVPAAGPLAPKASAPPAP